MNGKKKRQQRRRYFVQGVVLFVLAVQLMTWAITPAAVKAIGGGPVVVTADIPAQTKSISDQISQTILQGLLGSLVNMASYFMRTLAYDTASYIASGGKGQGSLIFEKPFDEYLASVADKSVGEAINSLGTSFGVNLCQPPNLKLQASLKIGLDKIYNSPAAALNSAGKAAGNTSGTSASGPQASCSWQQIKDNWSNGIDVSADINAAADFASEVNVAETDFGFALGSFQQLEDLKAGQEAAASLEALVGNGFKNVTDLVSGHINTPAQQIQEETKSLTAKHQGELSSQQISGIYASGLWQVIPTAASVFLNTLTSQLLNRVFTGGLVPSEKERGQGVADFYAINAVISQRQVAQRAFSFLTAKTGTKDPSDYDILAEFTVCPNSPGLNNCVMDRDIKTVIDRALIGKPMTLYDAVFGPNSEISPNTPLISPRRVADNEDVKCYKGKLCYSNIQKMRKARIMPLGMEIAALRSDPDNPWTIGEVLQGFEKCPTLNVDGSITSDITNFPFCHLVNPNWILRAPDVRCENRVYSPELLVPESPRRHEDCVDISTCLTEDENGNCVGDKYYGFCTQEKNVWFFPGDTCEPAFASCKAYTNQETRTIVSYLSRTLEYGSCNENAVGCLPYVTEKAVGTDEWVGTKDIQVQNKLAGAQQSMYFNDRISAGNGCPDTEDGCSSFIGAQRNSTTGAYITDATKAYIQDFNRVRNLKKAPNYLGCYDTDFTPTSPEVNYPATPLDLPKLTSDFRCDAYASVCLPEEVGCEAYTPVGGGETIPGVVGGNFCPDACVGYSTFRQEETKFEAGEYPLYFIPTNGTECSAQHAGCDEFTNISDASKGGEKLEYYTYIKQCEEPTGNNSSVYYSWEGSESAGFVLRVHTLAKVGERAQFIPASFQADFVTSSPAYADDSLANLTENDGLCNETLYNNVINKTPDVPRADDDCRALYDTNGTVYYRLLAETVTVSSACHPIRKTESRLVAADQTISTQNTCLQKNGYWDGTSCQLCYGGGSWVPDAVETTKGSCVYYAIDAPGESTSCPAVANECRAYTGNAGNNIKPVFESITDTFDPIGDTADSLIQAKASWTPSSSVNIVAESLQVSFNSLRVDGGVSGDKIYRALPAASIEAGTSYELTFWARGTAQTLSIYLEQGGNQWSLTTDPLTNANLPISISQTWRSYTVGPVTFPGDASSSLRLVFDRTGSPQRGVYFIDNVSLTRTTSNVYLLRDSWKTREGYDAPVACFSSQQNPNGPFPGAALGCAAYTTSLGQKVNATSFERLCREKAVGCAPLWDTFNSNAAYAEVYNATCFNGQVDASGGILTTPVDAVSECAVKVDNNTYTCSIQKGKSDCTILGPIQIPSNAFIYETAGIQTVLLKETAEASIPLGQEGMYAMIDASSVYIPADTALDSPLYLTDTKQSRCDKEYLGCQIVGLEEQHTPDSGTASSYVYKKQTIFNLPSTYVGEQGTLCTQEQVACSAFTTSDGSTNYFKDPGVNANKLCVYQEPQQNDPNAPQGWFLKSVGQCSQNDKILCDSDATCGEGNTCDNIGESKPCYPNYQEDRDSYGLWSNGSDQYGGYVGECPATQNLCTELVDSYDIDTSGKNPNGKPYYVIYDERVTAPADECKDGASLREGCVLFDKTDVPTKSFDTNATYDASEARAKKGNINASVIPVSTSQNDANVLLKVGRNRECSEWLACKSFEPIQTADGKQTFACESFAPCTELSASGSCATWTADNEMRDPSDSYLNMKKFISRNTSWNGSEYTGYSLFDTFNLGDLQSINISINDVGITSSTVDTANAYIAYVIPNSYFDDNSTAVRCNSNGQGTGEMCGVDGEGRCIGKKCVIPADGSFDSKDIDLPKIAIALGEVECKVPPEVDSPFSFDIVSTEKRDAHSFAKDVVPVEPSEQTQLTRFTFSKRTSEANVCQGEDCTCNYVKISYGSSLVKDYWGVDTYHQNKSKLDVWGVCTGASETEGDYCDQDSDCVQGMCQKIDRIEAFVGSTGHCLEYDKSRPIFDTNGQKNYACLTWYPSDKSFGNIDTGNLYPEAGYYPSIDAKTGDKGIAGLVYCTDSFGRSGGAYEGSLTISPRYGGTSVGHGSIIDVSTVVLANLYNDIAPSSNYVRGGDPSHLETDGLPPYNQYELDDTTCTLPITEGNMFVENADVNNEIQLGFKTLYGRHYMQTYPVSCNFSGLDTQDFVGFGPADLDLNPYLWYVCGTKFANQDLSGETSSCSGDSVTSYTIGDALTSLYSFVSLFAWDHIDHNAVVLRVEGDSTSRLYNSEHLFGSVPIGTDTYMMSALLPYPYTIGHDSRTLVHPPRFENNGGQLTFKVEQENMTLDTRCHAAGGCPQEEETLEIRSSESEKYLNLAALESVYFLPLRTPGGTLMSTPAIVSRDLVINFGEELYTKTGIVAPESSGGYAEFSDKIRINNDVSVTSYKLQKDENSILPCNGLISFCDYSPNNYVFSSHFDASQSITFLGNSLSAALLPRNQIATRYVMTHYASSGHVPDFVNNSPDKKFVGATSLDTDPFTSDCGHNRGNFLAIGMDFNSDGEFLGYISRNCNGENEERAFGVQMAVVATMKEQCSEFISVYHDALLSDSTNKAWTNRVWKDSRFSLAVQAQTSQQFLRNTPRSPFGSTDLTHEDIIQTAHSTKVQTSLLSYVFSNPTFGYPLFCHRSGVLSRSVFGQGFRCSSLVDDGYDANTIAAIDGFTNMPSLDSGKAVLSRLFARSYAISQFPFSTIQTEIVDLQDTDPSVIVQAKLQVPQIFSLNPLTCFPREDSSYCSAGKKNAISVGEFDSGQIVGNGAYLAQVRFFGFADDNRMPIRRVWVNWDDGNITNEGITGMYKNSKPYCEPSENTTGETSLGYCRDTVNQELTFLTCHTDEDCPIEGEYSCINTVSNTDNESSYTLEDEDIYRETLNDRSKLQILDSVVAPRFGNLPRACETKPFEYYHTYGCVHPTQTITMIREQITTATYNKLIQSGLNDNSKVCVYQPKVQILDNWGYCNGSCNGAGNTGCYNDDSVGGNMQCNDLQYDQKSDPNHWTFYQGLIIVTP